MVRPIRQALIVVVFLGLAACGGGGGGTGPTGPSTTTLSTPTNFRITNQQVFMTANQVTIGWSGSASTYRVTAGTTTGASDLLTADVTGTTYTWMAPREESVYYIRVAAVQGSQTSSSTVDYPVYTIDLRHVIDALFFRSGPMADDPARALINPRAGVWAPGTDLSIVVSSEAGEVARAASQQFADEYKALANNSFSATATVSSETFRDVTLDEVPEFTIYTRILSGFCGVNVIACAYYGPTPVGPNRSIVTQNGGGGSIASAHELGHAYGMGHVSVSGAVRPELNFMMNPVLVSEQMTEPEKNAISAALQGGIVAGTLRSEALAMGLVLPYSPTSARVGETASSGPRPEPRCTIR